MQQQDLKQLATCRRCPRLTAQFKRLRDAHPTYWNHPVPPGGDAQSPLLIVGLAPGMHGANRTGIPFTGDSSGDLLFKVLRAFELENRIAITNAVKCLPIKNLPSTGEIANCQRYLAAEVSNHTTLLVLGTVAHRAVLSSLGIKQAQAPFSHGAVHRLPGTTLVDSYHCSRYNTQTRRLTEAMFRDVVESAARIAGLMA